MFAIYIILCIIVIVVYYIYNYYQYVSRYPPGPRPLPFIGNLLLLHRSNTHKQFELFAKTYGPVLTVFTPFPIVIITKYNEIKEALVKQGTSIKHS
jgi:hypothetical protein